MATLTFDGPNKLITVDAEAGSTSSVLVVEIYSRWKDWVKLGNAEFDEAFAQSVGGNDLGASLLDPYIFIRNDLGWRIRPDERDHELTITGNLYGFSPSVAKFDPTLGGFTVPILLELSSKAQSVGGGITLTEYNAIADDIKNHVTAMNWAASAD